MSPSKPERGVLSFVHPEPDRGKKRILPVFLPFAGCPERCVYCAQQAVTGNRPAPLEDRLAWLRQELASRQRVAAAPVDVGFFGGTFTALPAGWPDHFLDAAVQFKACGTVGDIRCSTRPDATAPSLLHRLRTNGLDMVELGIQSFNDSVLQAARRGYSGLQARDACRRVKDAGLELGIQLMPGLPGMDANQFKRDIDTALDMAPAVVRLYPTMVLEGTELGRQWRQGTYTPWGLNDTVRALGDAVLRFWKAGIPVIRIGLPPEPGLRDFVLAGPEHPALGQLVRSRALFLHIMEQAARLGAPVRALTVPKRFESDFLGHSRCMEQEYAAAGIPNEITSFVQQKMFELQ